MNKILVSIQIPSIEQNFDLFIPINKKVGTIKRYVVSSINELSKGLFNDTHHYIFFDVDTAYFIDKSSKCTSWRKNEVRVTHYMYQMMKVLKVK